MRYKAIQYTLLASLLMATNVSYADTMANLINQQTQNISFNQKPIIEELIIQEPSSEGMIIKKLMVDELVIDQGENDLVIKKLVIRKPTSQQNEVAPIVNKPAIRKPEEKTQKTNKKPAKAKSKQTATDTAKKQAVTKQAIIRKPAIKKPIIKNPVIKSKSIGSKNDFIQSYKNAKNIKTEHIPIMHNAEMTASSAGKAVLRQARKMGLDDGTIIKGSCWDYLNAVFNRAGVKRKTIHKGTKRGGKYVNTNILRSGDWLYHINLGYHNIEHSGMFIGWVDKSKNQALMFSYRGQGSKTAGRYRVYDLSKTYNVMRPTM